jgi:hypothetical protein
VTVERAEVEIAAGVLLVEAVMQELILTFYLSLGNYFHGLVGKEVDLELRLLKNRCELLKEWERYSEEEPHLEV